MKEVFPVKKLSSLSTLSCLIWCSRFSWAACAIVAVLTTFLADRSDCMVQSMNVDIGGIGVQVGLGAPVLCITISLILGHFHGEEDGTKELGIVQLTSEQSRVTYN